MKSNIEDVLKAKYLAQIDFANCPGSFEKISNIAEDIIKNFRDNEFTYSECKYTIAFALQLLEYCYVGKLVDFENETQDIP